MTTRLSGTQKLLNALASGENISIAALEKRTGLRNLSATVNRLRRDYDMPIYWNTRKKNGRTVNYYRLDV